jgi:hypothetical protein
MKLITELAEEVQYLSEATEDGKKKHYIHGIFIQADKKNRNGRLYPLPIVQKEVKRYLAEVVANKRAYGELGHPAGPQINLDRVSHIITELKQDGPNFIGKALITETPMGNIVRGLLESGANLGASTRGLGSLKPNKEGIMEVQEDFHLATAADIVADPSAPDAFVKGIMENVEWVYDSVRDTWLEEKLGNIKASVHKMSSSQLEDKKLSIFEDYVSYLLLKK